MTEPKRWLDDGASQSVERMLRAAGDERPSAASLERALVGVASAAGVMAAASSAAGSKVAVTAASSSGVFLKWSLIGFGVALGTAGVATGVSSLQSPPPAASAPIFGKRMAQAAQSPPVVADTQASAEAARAPPLPPPQARSRANATNLHSAQEEVVDTELLAVETSLVDRARSELAAGRAAAAIAALDDYQVRFPAPRYAPEALYLRMEALLAKGDHGAAKRVATRLVNAYPASPHRARAESVLASKIP